ncbi:MAG: hypothetical protein K2X45_08005 [Phreatobacter sp.]|jgi:hypothetical protein|nr:hypothetical protein [Phreatobacter sp.]
MSTNQMLKKSAREEIAEREEALARLFAEYPEGFRALRAGLDEYFASDDCDDADEQNDELESG